MNPMLKLIAGCTAALMLGAGCVYVEEGGEPGDWNGSSGDDWNADNAVWYGGDDDWDDDCHGIDCGAGADDGCGAGCAECVSGICVDFHERADECLSDAACAFDGVCIGGECMICPDDCSFDDDCQSGWKCSTEDVCIPDSRCRADSDCGAGRVCAPNGFCSEPLGELPLDEETDPDDSEQPDNCPDTGCVTHVCQFNSDCAAGDWCINGECRSACDDDADCPTSESCDPTVCEVSICMPDAGGGEECLYNSECENGVCENGHCIDRCTADADCGSGEFCDVGSCRPDHRPQPQCHVNADCATGEVCSDAKCRQVCTCDEDCGDVDVFTCDAGACLPRAESSPQCQTAAHCATGHNCVNGACE